MPKKKIVSKCKFDKFYTKWDVAFDCISKTKAIVGDCTFIEPSAGCGSFSTQLDGCLAYDIKPEHESINEANFFDLDLSKYGKTCVIGNPPFGSRNRLTKDFIKHAISFPNVKFVAFILPECFNKHTMQSVFPECWSLVYKDTLPHNSFFLEGEEYHVPCVFQIWEFDSKGECLRERKCLPKCSDFEILPPSRKNEADMFSFGAAPYNIIEPSEVQPNNRGYYLKSFVDKSQLLCNIKSVDWKGSGASSVSGGVFWVSKDEYIKIYCKHFNKEMYYV